MRWRVLGCGVSGLSCATVLAESGHAVEIWGRELPPHTTSDVAAAYWHPYRASPRDPVLRWSSASLDHFLGLLDTPASGVHLAPVLQVSRGARELPWWSEIVPDLELVEPRRLDPALAEFPTGFAFSAPVVDTSRYLPYLIDRVEAAGGVILQRAAGSFDEAAQGVDGVVHCCGLDARRLTDDPELFPIRGEIVRIENPGIDRVLVDEHSPGGPTYIVPRRETCILGGTALDGNESLEPDDETFAEIRRRCEALDPRVVGRAVDSTAVGLRPGRSTVRLELDRSIAAKPVIHNYGHGGAGITLSWGCAVDVAKLAAEA